MEEMLCSHVLSAVFEARPGGSTSPDPPVGPDSSLGMKLTDAGFHRVLFPVDREEGEYEISHGPSGVSR